MYSISSWLNILDLYYLPTTSHFSSPGLNQGQINDLAHSAKPICYTLTGRTLLHIIMIFFFSHLHLTMINLLIGIVEEAINVLMITRKQTERPFILSTVLTEELWAAAE